MPTSDALTPQNDPCYYLGPSDLIGSFQAVCSDDASSPPSNNNNKNISSTDEPVTATTSPGLQNSPSPANGVRRTTDSAWWVEMGTKALLAMGAVEVIAWA